MNGWARLTAVVVPALLAVACGEDPLTQVSQATVPTVAPPEVALAEGQPPGMAVSLIADLLFSEQLTSLQRDAAWSQHKGRLVEAAGFVIDVQQTDIGVVVSIDVGQYGVAARAEAQEAQKAASLSLDSFVWFQGNLGDYRIPSEAASIPGFTSRGRQERGMLTIDDARQLELPGPPEALESVGPWYWATGLIFSDDPLPNMRWPVMPVLYDNGAMQISANAWLWGLDRAKAPEVWKRDSAENVEIFEGVSYVQPLVDFGIKNGPTFTLGLGQPFVVARFPDTVYIHDANRGSVWSANVEDYVRALAE